MGQRQTNFISVSGCFVALALKLIFNRACFVLLLVSVPIKQKVPFIRVMTVTWLLILVNFFDHFHRIKFKSLFQHSSMYTNQLHILLICLNLSVGICFARIFGESAYFPAYKCIRIFCVMYLLS